MQTLQALNINNMSIEETKIVFTVVQRLKTSRPGDNSLRVMTPKVLRNKSICPYSHLLHYIDRSTSLTKLSDSTQLFISLNKPHKGVTSSSLARWIKDKVPHNAKVKFASNNHHRVEDFTVYSKHMVITQ